MGVVGEALKLILEREQKTQKELGVEVGRTQGSIGHLISGRKKNISVEFAKKLEKSLGVSADLWLEMASDEKAGVFRAPEEYLRAYLPSVSSQVLPGVLVNYQIETVNEYWTDFHRNDADGLDLEETPEAFVIAPFNAQNLEASSYVLTLGGYYDGQEAKEFSEDDGYELEVGEKLRCYSEELIKLPENMHARICTLGRLTNDGVEVKRGGLIHPKFCEHINFRVVNETGKKYTLTHGLAVLRLIFEKLPVTPSS